MKAEKYYPGSMSGFPDYSEDFNTTSELLKIPWIKSWKKFKGFYRFSLYRDSTLYDGKPQHSLMVECDKGYKWYVVAYIRDKDISALDDMPEWEVKHSVPLCKFRGLR